MVVVVFGIETNLLLLVFVLRQTFIVLTSIERPQYCFPSRLPHFSQGSVLGGVQINNLNGIKHPYIIRIVLVAVALPLVPVLALIVIIPAHCNYCPCTCPLSSLVMGCMKFLHFVLEATERLVQQKKLWLENPLPLDNRRRASTTVMPLVRKKRKIEYTGLYPTQAVVIAFIMR